MVPLKKSKSINREFVSPTESSSSIDGKSKHKMRKSGDILGPQWSKRELERFYDAYRKYGKDWMKVASVVRSRSIGMVEALYNMNRAYLSLPEGTASVVGLIAMMTDHYNVMDGSDSEKESEVPEVMVRKIHKKTKVKSLANSSRNSIKCHSGSNDGCVSLLKSCGEGIQSHLPVRKRTPRTPVAYLDDNSGKKSHISGANAIDEGLPHGVSKLTEEWKEPKSPLCLQKPYNKFEHMRALQVSAKGHETYSYGGLKIKNGGYASEEESKEVVLGCNLARNGNLTRDSIDSGESALAMSRYKKGSKRKKDKIQHSEYTLFDNIGGEYEYADKVARNYDDKSVKICRSTSDGQRKRSKKLMHEDELAACDALRTLAEMSSKMPFLDGEKHVEDAGESVFGRDDIVGKIARSDVALCDDRVSRSQKNFTKACKAENPDYKSAENKSVVDEELKYTDNSAHLSAIYKRSNSSPRSLDLSSSNDPPAGELEVALYSAQDHPSNQAVNLRRRNKRKRERALLVKDRSNATSVCLTDGLSALQDNFQDVRGKLSHCLSQHEVRRWCMYEWFYSAIDYPWFAKREFDEYLNHVGFKHIPKLTRFELSVIRSSLGRPRRFSEQFLRVEREKLQYYRDSVRNHYAILRASKGGLPADLACPLYVGQQVVAIHPKTRECHNGSVLAVGDDYCRVHFHNPDLGVELITDIDCMPLNPSENIPEATRWPKRQFDDWSLQVPKVNGTVNLALEEHMKNANDIKVGSACLNLHNRRVVSGRFLTQSGIQNHTHNMVRLHPQEAYTRLIPRLAGDMERKATDQETASHVAEIIEGSQEKAQKLVDTAIKALSTMKRDKDAFRRIVEALNVDGKAECATSGRSSMTTNFSTSRGSFPPQADVTSHNLMNKLASDGKSDLGIPSDLIKSCVATLLMIQTCTERQCPPGEVAQILDNAATSLQPCYAQNMSIYREIQMCMGRLKTQILALVPT